MPEQLPALSGCASDMRTVRGQISARPRLVYRAHALTLRSISLLPALEFTKLSWIVSKSFAQDMDHACVKGN